MFDLVIKQGNVIDGTGALPYCADIAIRNGKIVRIGNGLKSKGLIKEGFDADLCIFDAEKICDRSEYTNCHERAQGLNFVILNGKIVVENAIFNGTMAGKVLLSNER